MNFGEIGFLTGIVMAISQMLKELGINPKLIPIINVLLGIIGGIVYTPAPIENQIMSGIIVGLTAGGFYSGIKHTKEYLDK